MKLNLVLAAILTLPLVAWATPPACAQGSIIATQAEVTSALLQGSLTIEAIKKADDAKGDLAPADRHYLAGARAEAAKVAAR